MRNCYSQFINADFHKIDPETLVGSGVNSASLAADYLRRGGSYIDALNLLLADLKVEQDPGKGVLLCDTMNELRIFSGPAPVSKWTNHAAYS